MHTACLVPGRRAACPPVCRVLYRQDGCWTNQSTGRQGGTSGTRAKIPEQRIDRERAGVVREKAWGLLEGQRGIESFAREDLVQEGKATIMRQALVIRHVACEDLGTLAGVLQQRGLAVRYVEAGAEDLAQLNPLAPAVLIVLGGPIGVYQAQDYPFLADELRLLERRLAADLPTLGICLGAQLMARALGAKVYVGPRKEIGWAPLQLSEAGWRSCLAQLAKREVAVLHWHGDTFDLPAGATPLASTPAYDNQAFAWGTRGLALQCHVEVTTRGLERWFISHAHEIERTPGVSVGQLRQDTQCYAPRLQVRAACCWQTWLHKVLAP
jgi:GMP synthase (glutamine-hydrolysing)